MRALEESEVLSVSVNVVCVCVSDKALRKKQKKLGGICGYMGAGQLAEARKRSNASGGSTPS